MHNKIIRYQVQNSKLKQYIKFYWHLKSDELSLNHKHIPTRNINLRINLSVSDISIKNCGTEKKMNKIFFSGLFNKESENYIINEGALNIFGICFKTSGFYPFINSNLYEFKNHFWNLNETKLKFSSNFYNKLIETTTNEEIIEIVEKELYNNLLTDNQQFNKFKEIFHYYENSKYSRDISEFCLKQKINIRKFERDFNKYIGISAKSYTSINRFQNSINQLLNKDFDKLSDIAYENGYYDQTHYINEFKKFTGNNPKKFDQQKNSLLNIGKLKEK